MADSNNKQYGNPDSLIYIDGKAHGEAFFQELAKQVEEKMADPFSFINEVARKFQFETTGHLEWAQPLTWDDEGSFKPEGNNYDASININREQKAYFNKTLNQPSESGKEITKLNDRHLFFCNGSYQVLPLKYPKGLQPIDGTVRTIKLPWIKVKQRIIPVNPFIGGGIEGTPEDMKDLVTKILSVTGHGPAYAINFDPLHNNGLTRGLGQWGPNFAVDAVVTSGEGDEKKVIAHMRKNADGIKGNHVAAMIGGFMEASAGFFCMIQELIEEGRILPNDLNLVEDGELPFLLRKDQLCHQEYLDEDEEHVRKELEKLPKDATHEQRTEATYNAMIHPQSILDLLSREPDFAHGKLNRKRFEDELRAGKVDLLLSEVQKKTPEATEEQVKEVLRLARDYVPDHLSFPMTIMESDKRNSAFSFMVSHGVGVKITNAQYETIKSSKSDLQTSESAGLVSLYVKDIIGPENLVTDQFRTNIKVPIWGTHYPILRLMNPLQIRPLSERIAGVFNHPQGGGKPKRTHKKRQNKKTKKRNSKSTKKQRGGKARKHKKLNKGKQHKSKKQHKKH